MHLKAKKLIINADDFGLCDSVSRGILDCLTKGLVSDFSFIINPDTYRNSVEMLEKHGIHQCGIHFNLTLGRTYFSPAINITDEHGNYFSARQHLINTLLGKLDDEDVYAELRRQMDLLTDDGFKITHFDTHQNVHILPPVYRALKKLSAENGNIPIRIPKENISILYPYKLSNFKRILIFNLFSFLIRNLAKNSTPVRAIGGDFYNNPKPEKVIIFITGKISVSNHETFELAVHPGYFSEDILKYDPYAIERETELRYLINPGNQASFGDLQITSFGDLQRN